MMTRGPGGVLNNQGGFSTLFAVTCSRGMVSGDCFLVQNHFTNRGKLGGVNSQHSFYVTP